jgi:hypothetical protein
MSETYNKEKRRIPWKRSFNTVIVNTEPYLPEKYRPNAKPKPKKTTHSTT